MPESTSFILTGIVIRAKFGRISSRFRDFGIGFGPGLLNTSGSWILQLPMRVAEHFVFASSGQMSRLLSCGTLSAGVPLLTANAGPMEDGMNIEEKIAAPCPYR